MKRHRLQQLLQQKHSLRLTEPGLQLRLRVLCPDSRLLLLTAQAFLAFCLPCRTWQQELVMQVLSQPELLERTGRSTQNLLCSGATNLTRANRSSEKSGCRRSRTIWPTGRRLYSRLPLALFAIPAKLMQSVLILGRGGRLRLCSSCLSIEGSKLWILEGRICSISVLKTSRQLWQVHNAVQEDYPIGKRLRRCVAYTDPEDKQQRTGQDSVHAEKGCRFLEGDSVA